MKRVCTFPACARSPERMRAATVATRIVPVVLVLSATAWMGARYYRVAAPATEIAEGVNELVALEWPTRPFEPRLAGGFPYAPVAAVRRAAAPAGRVPPDRRLAAARLEKRLESGTTAARLEDYAAGALLTGDAEAAIASLMTARRLNPRSARTLNDLSAAYLVRAESGTSRAGPDRVRALNYAAAALEIEPTLREAWFNRALASRAILPIEAVREAWAEYLHVDGTSPWAAEARIHRDAIPEGRPATPSFLSAVGDIATLVHQNPQRARENFMEAVVPAWGRALIAGELKDAERHAARAHAMADALWLSTHDPFGRETVRDMRDAAMARDTALAYELYASARKAYQADRLEDAHRLFRKIRETLPARSPLVCWADLQLATIAIDRRRIADGEQLLRAPARRARASGYLAAAARASWLQGVALHQSNRVDAALEAYDAAARQFAQIGERENELAVYTAAADNLRLRGERQRSWGYVLLVLMRGDEIDQPLRRYLAYFNAALFAADEGWLHASLIFQDHAVREARNALAPGAIVEALTTRARILYRLDRPALADATLREARDAMNRSGVHPYSVALIEVARGEGLIVTQPERAEPALSRALQFFARAEPAIGVRLHQLRGRARLALGNAAGAAADFQSGIEQLERRRLGIDSRALRVSYLDDSSEIFSDMVALQLSIRKDEHRAFEYAERGRARALLDASQSGVLPLGDVQRTLPPATALIEYKVLPSGTACWVVTATGRHFVELPVRAEMLAESVEQFRLAVQGADQQHARGLGRQLHALVLEPVESYFSTAETLVIVGDGALARLPFAALVSSRNRFLVEEHAVTTAWSAATFAAATRRASARRTRDRVLLVSDPTRDITAFPGLVPLPGAVAEVRALTSIYPDARTLAGAWATKAAFLRELPLADVVHFAGHALENVDHPKLSTLVLAPDRTRGDSGALRAYEIAALRLRRAPVVVLAACDTADGPVGGGEGVHNLARPFLEAGALNVVAALWPIDDGSAAQLFQKFHQHYAEHRSSAEALRVAQLEMLRSPDPAQSHPRAWAGVTSMGAIGKRVRLTSSTKEPT